MLISDLRESTWGQEHVRAKGEERDLLMLFRCGAGPVVYALYRVKVPYLSAYHEFSCHLKKKKSTPPEALFHPILELPVSLYPMEMCCVELHNKLYFLGGHFDSAKYRQAKLPAYDIYAFDPTDVNFDDEYDESSSYRQAMLLRKNVAGKLIRAKPFPYAFVALDKIFVIDNLGQLYIKSCFEVFDPNDEESCMELPDVPVDFIISGHAVVGEKIFLNGHGRGRVGHVICFDAETKEWMQDFIQDFSDGHMFYKEAKVVGDTIYALAGDYLSTPVTYKISSEHLQYNLNECAAMNSELPLDEHATNLFDECAFLSPGLEEVHQLVSKNWLRDTKFVHMGDGAFCYMRSGKFPHESYHEYSGVVLAFFKPHDEAFTETANHTSFTSFSGQFLHSAQLKFYGSRPGGTVSLYLCSSIPKGRKYADGGHDKLQVVWKPMIRSEESRKDAKRWELLLHKQLLEVEFMEAENKSKGLQVGWGDYLMNLHKEGDNAMEKLKRGDTSGRKDVLKFKKGVKKALRYATYLRQLWEMDLPKCAGEVFLGRLEPETRAGFWFVLLEKKNFKKFLIYLFLIYFLLLGFTLFYN